MEGKYAKGYVYIATSLDGFIAREDHSLDWLMKYETDKEDTSFTDFTSTMDALVMGSGTYNTVMGFGVEWPYKLPTFVLSKTLKQTDVPDDLQEKVIILNKDPKEVMELLYQQDLKKIYVDGGKLVQAFIQENLIDEMTITQIPILLGKGKRLFGEVDKDIDLELISSKRMNPSFLQNHYKLLK